MITSVITGGAGFLGTHLTQKLLKVGHKVIVVDNLLTGSYNNVKHLLSNPNYEFIHNDITNGIPVPALKIDYVWHFASPASPIDYLKYPIETMRVGAEGTLKALRLATNHGADFLLASTSECYGDPLISPQVEEYWGNVNPIGPRGVYDEAKRYAEALTMAFHKTHGTETHIVRIFSTYGELMRPNDGRAIPNFIMQALQNKDVTIFGDGCQTRCVCYVSDLIEGIYKLMYSNYHLPMNIGNPEECTMLELAKEIIQLTNSNSKIVFEALPKDDPKVRRPDITKAQTILGWTPKVQRTEGLIKTINYFKQQYGYKTEMGNVA